MVSVMFVRLVLVFAATPKEMALLSSRKSCSLAGGFVSTRSHRGGRVLVFVSSGIMISMKSIDVHIGHESSVGVYLREEIKNISNRIGNTPWLASCLSV